MNPFTFLLQNTAASHPRPLTEEAIYGVEGTHRGVVDSATDGVHDWRLAIRWPSWFIAYGCLNYAYLRFTVLHAT